MEVDLALGLNPPNCLFHALPMTSMAVAVDSIVMLAKPRLGIGVLAELVRLGRERRIQ